MSEKNIILIPSPFPQQVQQRPSSEENKAPLRKSKKWLYWLLFFFLVALLAAGLVFWKIVPLQERGGTIYIAAAGPMTGSGQANGQAMVRGVQLYLDQINSQGGVHGKKVELLIYDDQNDTARAKQIAEEIATQSQALAVIGHQRSSTTIAAAEVYQKYGVPAVTGTATADSITVNSQWYFRTIFNNGDQGALVANYIRKVLNFNEANVIFDQDVFGATLAESFIKTAKSIGLTVKHQWSFNAKDKKNIEDSIRKMVATLETPPEPAMVFVATAAQEGVQIVTSLKPLSHVQMMGADTFSSSAFMGELGKLPQERSQPGYYSNGIYTTSPFLPDIADEVGQQFKYAFFAKYAEEPTINSSMYYDATLVILQALSTMENMNAMTRIEDRRTELRNQLRNISTSEKSVKGVTGNIFFDRYGNAVKAIPVGTYRQGRPVVALFQFQPLGDLRSVDNLLGEFLDNHIINVNGKFMRRAQVVYAGIDFNEISELDTKTSSFVADFYLWFRYQGKLDDSGIEFVNIAVEKKELKDPVVDQLSKLEPTLTTKTYRLKAKFKGDFDYHDYPLDRQTLPIKFRHQKLTKDHLIYVVDNLGMKQYQGSQEAVVKQFDKKKVFTVGGWKIQQASFFQNTKNNDSTLGLPELFDIRQPIEYSQFNAQIQISRQLLNFMLKNFSTIIFLMVLGYFSFFIPISSFATRLSLGTSLIMTGSLFHIKLSSELANIDYLVLIEYLFYMIYLLATFVVVVSVICHILDAKDAKGNKQLIDKLNRWGKIIYPLVLVAGFGVIGYLYRHLLVL